MIVLEFLAVVNQLFLGETQVFGGGLEQTFIHIRLSQYFVELLFTPLTRRQILQKDHDFRELHELQLVLEVKYESSTDVDVKLSEAVLVGDIGISEPQHQVEGLEFSDQQTAHSPEGKLQKHHFLVHQMVVERHVHSTHYVFNSQYRSLNTWRRRDIEVLNLPQDLL